MNWKAHIEILRKVIFQQARTGNPESAAFVKAALEQASRFLDVRVQNRLLKQLIIGYAESHKELLRLTRELEDRQRQIEQDLAAAAGIQQSLLPRVAPQLPDVKVSWQFLPSQPVGGDIFNLFMLDEHRIGVYMLDVSGHGVPAALLTVSVYQTLQPSGSNFIKRRTSRPPHYRIIAPGDVMRALEQMYPFERFEKYFSIFYAVIDIRTGGVAYCNAGHPPPLLFGKNGRIQPLDRGGGIIGVRTPESFETANVTLSAGDRLFIYTDGITEHANRQEETFGLDRLIGSIAAGRDKPLNTVLDAVCDAVRSFEPGKPPSDDISLLALAFEPESGA